MQKTKSPSSEAGKDCPNFIDSYLSLKLKENPNYKLSDWREIAIKGDISNFYHFGQVLGIGTYGLIREAVYLPSKHKPKKVFLSKGYISSDSAQEVFAIKTLNKSQVNIEAQILPNEILNLIQI